ncbi:DUF1513 domain-containing protein [Vibrio genomosp. F6]|uniref:DUF1513 domain-containing protein n=1 Tax=Vibrio genomosp. F6 str. FF-238 TaxID=1191298 RepID=A0A1E5CWM9_9VIBR|nr:DUF1513 domain-containing protein [Vibrio genomosp. F6]OEE74734.1 hypothetical protein A130_06065 [Vibrio genomosp. F6 str. FF-238]
MVTDLNRRTLLKAAMYGAMVPVLPYGCAAQSVNANVSPALIGCSLSAKKQYRAVVADESGAEIHSLPIPERGHGVAINSQHGEHQYKYHAAVFARRPGSYLMVFDYLSGEQILLRPADKNRHYYGHGVFSNDGMYLYATEGERGTSRGIIGVYRVQDGYKKVEEFSGFGLGPHEVIAMPDNTLAIGVGGVHTDGRKALNLDAMSPSLSYVSAEGKLLDQVSLDDRHLSIRHLAHDGSDTVLCGQQYRGEPDEYPSLLAMHRRGGDMVQLQAEPEQWARFNHYIASIAASDELILATSPRGNCYGIWSKESGALIELAALPDASGVIEANGMFKVSSGSGSVVTRNKQQSTSKYSGVQWDNHWSAI